VITVLAKKGIIEFFEREVYRSPFREAPSPAPTGEIVLTDEQQWAFEGLLKQYGDIQNGNEASPAASNGVSVRGAPQSASSSSLGVKSETALLYGVTGSGKTQVFLKLVQEISGQGRGVIVMIPEIALTPQLLAQFRARFGDKVALFHSAMPLGPRLDEWKRVKNGEAQIAVGTRSAVFAPFENLGLIIMDEEQEQTYKSEVDPRFHARDAARFRARFHGALLLLASATPSVETYAQAVNGRYKLFSLTKRYGRALLPAVECADMRAELFEGNTGVFSRLLLDNLRETLSNHQQAILLLNRRGHNTYVSCAACGFVFKCENCSISMTYHSANHRLMCHYCGYSTELRYACPQCGQQSVRFSGLGTQRAESELAAMFPEARILRMDADTTLARFSHEKYFNAFANREYDILLGTQMVAKGLDFPHVTLVGVLGADNALFSDDFRGIERTFSLLTQVAGRSGRGGTPGKAIIQTNDPQNPVIELAAKQDYPAFYEHEMLARRLMRYPPFCDICVLAIFAADEELAHAAAGWVLKKLKDLAGGAFSDERMIVLGPSPAAVPRVAGKYREKLIIKCKNSRRFREMVTAVICAFRSVNSFKNAALSAEINPEHVL
jgi:primosomal protein N' (replication factor Y)